MRPLIQIAMETNLSKSSSTKAKFYHIEAVGECRFIGT